MSNAMSNKEFNKKASEETLSLKTKLLGDIEAFAKDEFMFDDTWFCVVYGSYAKGYQSDASDIDVMFVSDQVDDARMNRCIDFIKNLHKENSLPLDTELRYEHKVLIPLPFLKTALEGNGFKDDNGNYYIPEIKKTREYLNSEELRHRFLLGMMTHKHIFVDGDHQLYDDLRNVAQQELMRAVTIARGHKIVTPELLADLFFKSGDVQGDFYLGFENDSYLHELSRATLNRMTKIGKATFSNGLYNLSSLWGQKPQSIDRQIKY